MTTIPRIFHFVFGLRPQTRPFHLVHYLCLRSCLEVNRPDRVVVHCQHRPWGDLWDRIAAHVEVVPIDADPFITHFVYADATVAQYRYAHLADIARLRVLADHGGIYADMDTLFVAPLPAHLFTHPFVMGREKVDWASAAGRAGGSLCNALMMARPGADFVIRWLDQTRQAFDGSWNSHSTALPYRLAQAHPELIHLEPQRSFFHFDWDPAGIKRLFVQDDPDLDGVYSIHLWAHLWWDHQRRDHTAFHAGRITPAHIRHAPTTYAGIARRFLDPDLGDQDWSTYRRESRRAWWADQAWAGLDRLRHLAGR